MTPRRPVTITVFLITAIVTALSYVHPWIVAAVQRTPAALRDHEWWRLVSPVLVNPYGAFQVAFNLTCLAIFGSIAERYWGGKLWMVFYLVGDVCGQLAGLAWKPIGGGSSVAICGLQAAVAVTLWSRVGTLPARFGAAVILGGAVALTCFHDLHGPPILVSAAIAAVAAARSAQTFR